MNIPQQKSKEVYEFKKQLKALEGFRGRGTELISVYITPGYQISDITNKLKEEAGQATNIKSAGTRKNVIDALQKIMAYLRTFKEPPKTGMAVFCGNVSEVDVLEYLEELFNRHTCLLYDGFKGTAFEVFVVIRD